jgi:hypothetical protein
MKFDEILAKGEEQVLGEVRMGDSDLNQFVSSDAASGIVAGFEAELCFRGLGESGDDDDIESERNMSEDRRARSIDDITEFYHDGDYNGRGDIRRLEERLREDYMEWRSDKLDKLWDNVEEEQVEDYIRNNDFDLEDEIETYLRDELDLSDEEVERALEAGRGSKQYASSREQRELFGEDEDYAHWAEARDHAETVLEDLVKEAIRTGDTKGAREEWAEEMEDDGDIDEDAWLEDEGIRYMSDIESNYEITWPYWEYPESQSGNSYNQNNAENLAVSLERSLDLAQVVASSGYHSTRRTPGKWIIEEDGSLEADDGDMPAEIVSPPMPLEECLDKLTEFFEWAKGEDAYTNESTGLHIGVSLPDVGGRVDYLKLALFLGDRYVLEKFDRESNHYCRSALSKIENDIKSKPESVSKMFELFQQGLIDKASETLTNNFGHGKYTSINLKGDYIEFRSMGGDYIDRVPEIVAMIKRYAYAMSIASRPELYRKEYAKKLYKLLSKDGQPSIIQLFSEFSAGNIGKGELKLQIQQVRAAASQNKQQAAAPVAANAASSTPATPRNSGGEWTGQWLILNAADNEVHRFGGIGNSQGDANRVATQWLRSQGLTNLSGFDVVPEMR